MPPIRGLAAGRLTDPDAGSKIKCPFVEVGK